MRTSPQRAWALACLSGLLLLTGCATVNLRVAKESSAAIPRTVILKIGVAPGVNMSEETVESFRALVVTDVSHRGFQVVSDKPAGPFVTLSGTVTLYDPGNRFGRWFGLARGKLDSTWTVSDPKGAELSRARIDGSVGAGALGSSIEDILRDAAGRVADYLAGVRK